MEAQQRQVPDPNMKDWQLDTVLCPQVQAGNTVDCGVMMLACMKCLCNGQQCEDSPVTDPNYEESTCELFRCMLTEELGNAKLVF